MPAQDRRTIDGLDVRVNQLPVLRQAALAGKLTPYLGQALTTPEDKSVWTRTATMLLEDLPLLLEVLQCTQIVVGEGAAARLREMNSEAAINEVLRGRLSALVKIAGFSLEANFGDFFAALVELAQTAIAEQARALAKAVRETPTPSPSASPTTSPTVGPGTPGASSPEASSPSANSST